MRTDELTTGAILKTVKLHENPEYLERCAELLNEQWPRSLSARIQYLEKSCGDLPVSLLLIEEANSKKTLVGHSRLTRVLEDIKGCWIGSVVISKEKRNKGYGKYLMKKTEEHAKSLKFATAYLNTKDQQGFYEHLGYVYGEAVSSVCFINGFMMKEIIDSPKRNPDTNSLASRDYKQSNENSNLSYDNSVTIVPPPPPPPPLTTLKTIKSNLGQFYMKKSL